MVRAASRPPFYLMAEEVLLMEPWLQVTLTVFSAVLASSGLWAFLSKKSERKDVRTKMLVGLAYDRIIYLGMQYIARGYITKDEYENLYKYLYKPYAEMGGDGAAKRVMKEVEKLPIRESTYGGKKEGKKEAVNDE